jgi:hypothetical protein
LALDSGLEIKSSQPFVGTNSVKSWMIAVKNNDSTEHQVEFDAVCAKLMRPYWRYLGLYPLDIPDLAFRLVYFDSKNFVSFQSVFLCQNPYYILPLWDSYE